MPRVVMAVDLLQRIGLNKYEAEAYFALLADGPLTGYELGKRSNVPLSKSYETLERLTRRGLALVQPGDPPRYTAERPDALLARTRAGQESLLAALSVALGEIERADPADDFWVVRGRQNVLAQASTLVADTDQAVTIGLSDPDAALSMALDGASARGCQVAVRRVDDRLDDRDHGRMSPDLIVLLADDSRALVGTLTPAAHCQAVVSANPALVATVRAALGERGRRPLAAPARSPEPVGAPTSRGTDWLEWEARKHRRLWRSEQGRRPA
jgi:sugar-specific transcriptional regulator TrmB